LLYIRVFSSVFIYLDYMIVRGLDPTATWDVVGLVDVDGDVQLSVAWADAGRPVRNRYRLPSPSANVDKGCDECASSICSTTITRHETENSTSKLEKRLIIWKPTFCWQWLNYSARGGGSVQSRGGVPDRRPGVFEHSRHSVRFLWHFSVRCLDSTQQSGVSQ